MKARIGTLHRRRRLLPVLAGVLVAALLPPLLVVGLTYLQALRNAETTLEQTVAGAVRRTNRLLDRADAALHRFIAESKGNPGEDVSRRLARMVYNDPRFREAGIIDGSGHLIVTNFGPIQPPVPVPPAERADHSIPALQVVGLVRTAVMEEHSVILALPIPGNGEVNVLVDPQVLTAYLQDLDLGPSGFVAFTMPDGRLLAVAGDPLIRDDRLQPSEAAQRLQRQGMSNRHEIRIVAEVERDWVLRDWRRTLWIVAAVTLAGNVVLAGLLYRYVRRPTGLDHDLRLGLKNDEFAIVYQPIVELETGRCVGAEALMRWHHPDHGVVLPDVFIPIAEVTGQIRPMTAWLVERAVREWRALLRRYPDVWISLNAPLTLFANGQITVMLKETLKASPLPSSRIRLEITERQMFEDGDGRIRATIAELNDCGIRVGLDDFGTGGCGMAQIVELDLAYLKLDKTFVREIGRDNRSTIVLDALIEMSRRLQLTMVGEGIERPEQAHYLREAKVSLGQGWLFATPMPVGDLQQFLARQHA